MISDMTKESVSRIVESLIFSSEKPLSLVRIKEVLEDVEHNIITDAIEVLKQSYEHEKRSYVLEEVAGGYQFSTKPEYASFISKLYKKHQDKIRGSGLETLAIIVYKQPITKAEIEAIRGVNTDSVLKTLTEKELIKIKGRKEGPGRPLLYGTTDFFLRRFGLKDLKSLPPLREFCEQDLDYQKLQERIEKHTAKRGDSKKIDEVANEAEKTEKQD